MVDLESKEKMYARARAAIDAIARGEIIILIDDEDRENEGDLVFAANHVSPEKINFMAKEARGLICLALAPEIVDRLKLPPMNDTWKGPSDKGTAFTVSIEARRGVSTGISAADRAETVKIAVSDSSKPEDLVVPGHIFPLKAKAGGVLERAGHTEGAVDLARLAGYTGAGVICEIMNDDGTMARVPDLEKFAKKHGLMIATIADLITYRLAQDTLVKRVEESVLHHALGDFRAILYENMIDGLRHCAIIKGSEHFGKGPVDVRVQKQRSLADVLAPASRARKGVHAGFAMLKEEKAAVFIYLASDGLEKFSLRDLEEKTADQQPPRHQMAMEERLYGIGAQILRDLGITQMRIHASTPRVLKALSGYGLEVTDTVMI